MSLEPSADRQTTAVGQVASPATSPAYVLVGSDGSVVAATEVFNRLVGADVIGAGAVGAAIAGITSGNQELLGLQIDGRHGERFESRVEAVLDARDRRLALIEIQVPRPADGRDTVIDWFATFADGSPAIVWLKDLDGRYAYINRQYSAQLAADPDAVVGHGDADLSQLEAIDGPRVKGAVRGGLTLSKPAAEPLSLEYTIPGFDRRPAFAALRFPLLDRTGEPLLVCGVASPADHGEIAKHECEHLLEAARWYRGDARQLRQDTMDAWRVTAVRPQGSLELEHEDEVASAAELAQSTQRAADAELVRTALEDRIAALQAQVASEHGRATDLEGSLSDARGRANVLAASLDVATMRAATVDAAHARIRELESMVGTASSAGVAAAESARQVMDLELQLRTVHAELEQERGRGRALEDSAQREQAERERARHDAVLWAAEERHRSELSGARDEAHEALLQARRESAVLQEELAQVKQWHQGELDAARAALEAQRPIQVDRDESERRVGEAERRVHEAERRVHEAERQAGEAERRLGAAELRASAVSAELAEAQQQHHRELNASNQRHQAEIGHLRDEHASLVSEQRDLAEREQHAQARIRELEQLAAGAGAASATAAEATRRSGEAERRATEAERRAQTAEEQSSAARSQVEGIGQRLRDAEAARQRAEDQLADLGLQLEQAHRHIDDLEAALHASRDQIARLERASAAATAAAAGPMYPPLQLRTPAALQPPPAAPPAPVPASPVPAPAVTVPISAAPVAQLGWDAAAQQRLADALGGCLNLRSILSESVRLVGTGGGWDVVVAWMPNEGEEKFSCAATWVRSPVDMARLETSMWQVRPSANASAIGASAAAKEIAWINDLAADGDRHLASVRSEGVNTVVLVPVLHQGQVFAVLELCTEGSAQESPEADAALRSIEVEISAANQRLTDSASANQWGRRRR